MKFTTSFPIDHHHKPIEHGDSIVLLGSCFSQNIGDKLNYYGFKTLVNPFGTLFNPHSIRQLLEKSIQQTFDAQDVHGSFSYLAHSYVNGNNASLTLKNLRQAGILLSQELATATHLIITLGSAWVYELKATGGIVANCHQQPQGLFNKRLLDYREILNDLSAINTLVKQINPTIEIILTLSPVRHTKDGMIENNRSKARLHDAIQEYCDQLNSYYFPAYEILMDELRDYRFYNGDMIHPSPTAVDYVWLRFRESVLHNKTANAIAALEKYRKLESHRPKNADRHNKLLEEASQKLKNQYPNLNLK